MEGGGNTWKKKEGETYMDGGRMGHIEGGCNMERGGDNLRLMPFSWRFLTEVNKLNGMLQARAFRFNLTSKTKVVLNTNDFGATPAVFSNINIVIKPSPNALILSCQSIVFTTLTEYSCTAVTIAFSCGCQESKGPEEGDLQLWDGAQLGYLGLWAGAHHQGGTSELEHDGTVLAGCPRSPALPHEELQVSVKMKAQFYLLWIFFLLSSHCVLCVKMSQNACLWFFSKPNTAQVDCKEVLMYTLRLICSRTCLKWMES